MPNAGSEPGAGLHSLPETLLSDGIALEGPRLVSPSTDKSSGNSSTWTLLPWGRMFESRLRAEIFRSAGRPGFHRIPGFIIAFHEIRLRAI
jgi:hypothetical protein